MNFLQIFTEQDGQFSSRRTGALFSLLFAAFLSVFIVMTKEIVNWYVFVPVGLFLFVSLFLWYITSTSEIKELALSLSNKKE
jgi:hypothetical protein